MLVQEMLEQLQTKLEGTQVTAIRAMDHLDPVISLGNHTQIDDLD